MDWHSHFGLFEECSEHCWCVYKERRKLDYDGIEKKKLSFGMKFLKLMIQVRKMIDRCGDFPYDANPLLRRITSLETWMYPRLPVEDVK